MRDKLSLTSKLSRRKGLTLMELLVVIGIISVLVGIIWVVFSSIREKSRIIYCINNLRHIHFAIEMYRQDYDGKIALIGQKAEFWELGLPLNPIALKPYAKTSLLYCPLAYFPNKPKELWMIGYMWAVWKGRALGGSGPEWADVIAKRGEEFPISADCNHNPRGDKEFPRKFVILLRLNGKIETKQIWVLGIGSHEW